MKREVYDVAIIGSGVGGMCAGALLAHSGYKTVVVEKLPAIGGRCSTVEYKGFKLTTGAVSFHCGGSLEQTFNKVRAKFDVEPLPPDRVLHYRIRGVDYVLSQKEGLKELISYASRDKGESDRVIDAMDRAVRWCEPSALISLRDWLLQYTHNETILDLFQAITVGHHGINLHDLPAREFFLYLKTPENIIAVFGFPRCGSIALMESLASTIRENGGDVWTRCVAKTIIVADGVVKGIVAEKKGEKIEVKAEVVISNAGPKATVKLVGEENFDKGYLREVKEVLRPANHIVIQCATPVEKPLMDSPRLYFTGTRRLIGIRCFTMLCPELAPQGRHLYFANGSPSKSLPPIDWRQEIELLLQDLHENLPGFDRCAEILIVNCYRDEWPVFRAWSGYELPQKTPIENLYNVGDGVKPSGWIGTDACAESARIVVEDINRRVNQSGS